MYHPAGLLFCRLLEVIKDQIQNSLEVSHHEIHKTPDFHHHWLWVGQWAGFGSRVLDAHRGRLLVKRDMPVALALCILLCTFFKPLGCTTEFSHGIAHRNPVSCRFYGQFRRFFLPSGPGGCQLDTQRRLFSGAQVGQNGC